MCPTFEVYWRLAPSCCFIPAIISSPRIPAVALGICDCWTCQSSSLSWGRRGPYTHSVTFHLQVLSGLDPEGMAYLSSQPSSCALHLVINPLKAPLESQLHGGQIDSTWRGGFRFSSEHGEMAIGGGTHMVLRNPLISPPLVHPPNPL